jgi:hypothetical protein
MIGLYVAFLYIHFGAEAQRKEGYRVCENEAEKILVSDGSSDTNSY